MSAFRSRTTASGKAALWLTFLCLVVLCLPPTFAQESRSDPVPYSSLLQQAGESLKRGHPQEARRGLEEAVRREPSSATAWSMLAAAYGQLGLHGKAQQAYETVLKLQPNSPNAHYNLGILLLNQQRCEDALRHLETFRRMRPQDREVLLPLAHCLLQLGRTREGEQALQDVSREPGANAETHLKVGQLLLTHRRTEEAIGPLSRALELAPGSEEARLSLALAESRLDHHQRVVELLGSRSLRQAPEYCLLLGVSLSRLGRHQEAIPLLEDAVREQTDEKSAYLNLALAYAGSSQNDRAVEVLQQARSRWPDERDIRLALAHHMFLKGEPAGAANLLTVEGSNSLAPDDLELLANCYVAMNRLEKAERFAERAVAEGGVRESTLLVLSNIYQLKARDPEVITLLEKHRAQFSGSARYLFTLAVSYYNRGNYSAARDLFAEVVSKDPLLTQAYYLTGSCLGSMGKLGDAIPYYEAAVRLVPDNSLYQFQLGYVLSMAGKKQLAEEHLRRSVELNGSHAPARYELAKIYAETSRDESAREQLEQAIKANPDFESSYYLLSQVYARSGRREDAARMMKQFQVIQRQRHEEERALKRLGASAQKP